MAAEKGPSGTARRVQHMSASPTPWTRAGRRGSEIRRTGRWPRLARTSIGMATILVGLVILGSVLPETSTEIDTIIGTADLATFGLYLDDNKDRLDAEVPGSRAWNYDNIPICGRKAHSEYCPNGWCASTQIARHRDILADARESKAHKQFAIWVLTHLIGDIHQPLHAADRDDRGGNSIQVRLPWGRNANLHGAWDTDFVEQAFGRKNEKLVAHDLLLKFGPRKTDWQTGLSKPGWTNRTNSPRRSRTERLQA